MGRRVLRESEPSADLEVRSLSKVGEDADTKEAEGNEDTGEIETPGYQGEWGLGVCGPLRALVQRRRLLTAGKHGEVRSQDLC